MDIAQVGDLRTFLKELLIQNNQETKKYIERRLNMFELSIRTETDSQLKALRIELKIELHEQFEALGLQMKNGFIGVADTIDILSVDIDERFEQVNLHINQLQGSEIV